MLPKNVIGELGIYMDHNLPDVIKDSVQICSLYVIWNTEHAVKLTRPLLFVVDIDFVYAP